MGFELWLRIYNATRQHPVTIRELQEATGLSERTIKGMVEAMRKDGEAIGAARGRNPGYYWIASPEDADAAAAPLVRQIRSMAETVRSMVSPSRYRELMGQAGFADVEAAR